MAAEVVHESTEGFIRHAVAWLNHLVDDGILTDTLVGTTITATGTVAKLTAALTAAVGGTTNTREEFVDHVRQANKAINFAFNAGSLTNADVEEARVTGTVAALIGKLTEDNSAVTSGLKRSFAF